MKSKSKKSLHFIYAIIDVILAFTLTFASFVGYYGINEIGSYLLPTLIYSCSVAVVTLVVFLIFKIYKIITTNIGLFESFKILLIVLAIHLVGLLVLIFVPSLPAFPEFLFLWALTTVSACFLHPSIRIAVRAIKLALIMFSKKDKVRTIVIGAGAAGKIVVDESRRNRENHNYIVAFVDDDVRKIGGSFCGIPVKGPTSNIAAIIKQYNAQEVIFAINEISGDRFHEILKYLDESPVRIRKLPYIGDMEGPNDHKVIDVDLDDLLCRQPVSLDNEQVTDMLHGQVVMVTGAGGSIGSELVRQIFNTHPKTLILFDIYENSTYDIQMELVKRMRNENITDIELVTLIGSTYNEFRVESVIKKYRPDYIYHAAAYKHVPLMEDSPAEAIRTNVIGTYNVAKFADKYHVKKMVLVSTDKAVRPTNVMGATKRFAETIIQYFADKSKHTAYAAVRFGNVLGSNGSVVPLFKKQIEDGGPITITDKEIIRYFMTIPEAVSLILQCGLFASGGEIFILDMGKPVKILSLAEKLIRQAGLVPHQDIDIIETGLRPGEKLYEELILDTEHQTKTENKKIFIEEKEGVKPIEEEIAIISKVFNFEETRDVKELLAKIIDTYTITENK